MAGAASVLFLLYIKGRVLIWRDYSGDVSAAQAERFFTKFIEKEGDPQSQDPVVYDNGVSYIFIQHNNIYLMIASRQNCNAASLLLFMHRVIDIPMVCCVWNWDGDKVPAATMPRASRAGLPWRYGFVRELQRPQLYITL
ncbi:hypothetical protein EV1_021346 [Malus domestica]